MIPDFTDEGLLPEGIHRASLAEIEDMLAGVDSSRQRRKLFANIVSLVMEATTAGFVQRILLAGSFVTTKQEPNDFDCLMGLDDAIVRRELRPFEYRLVSRRRARKAFGGDVFAFAASGPAFREYFEFFQKTRNGT